MSSFLMSVSLLNPPKSSTFRAFPLPFKSLELKDLRLFLYKIIITKAAADIR
jgi:hypothetical protein